ncbi:MAG: alginate export family protein [Woeseiaceae bacterium]
MISKTGGAAALLVMASTLLAVPTLAQEDDQTLAGAISSGKANVSFRYRYEHVDQDGFSDNANASTGLLRLNYRTGSFNNWSAFGEFDYVGEIFLNDFNSAGGSSPERNSRYPVVADPKGPDLNQLYVDYDVSESTKVRIGRQRIVFDNQRFVGGVAWRQNEQTYDGLGLTFKGLPNAEVHYNYVTTIRRIFGNDVPSGRWGTNTHLLNGKINLKDGWSVSPYLYLVDNDSDSGGLGLRTSTSTIGARLTGGFEAGDGQLNLVAELATQSDAGSNPVNYDAEYFNIGATWELKNGLSVGLSWESLGGDPVSGGASFVTPLSTLHLFQGWADKFLGTPNQGVDDFYVTVKYKLNKWNLTGVFHDFSAEAGSADWGTEIDVSAARAFGDRYGLLLKGAFYNADQFATDTNKFWVMFTARY